MRWSIRPAFALCCLPLCLAALVLLSLAPPSSSQAQPPTFGATVELVRLDVIVLDRDGKPVTGLARDDFVVEEGGRPQALETFEPVVVAARPVAPAAEAPRVSAARVRPPARVARSTSSSTTRTSRRSTRS